LTTKPRRVSLRELEDIKDSLYVVGGELRWKATKSGRRSNRAGTIFTNGYRKVMVNGKVYMAHRVIYYLHYGVWPDNMQVDHINGVPSDNRPENLRLVNCVKNHQSHKTKSRDKTSRYRGVSWVEGRKKWVTSITVNGTKFFIGRFTCEKEAALAYNYEALKAGFNKEAFNNVFGD